MKIAFYGNICNNLYQLALSLHQGSSDRATLYVEASGDLQTRPESDDPSLLDNLPDWIRDGNWLRGPHRIRSIVAPWTLPIIDELNKHDLVILSGEGMMLASFLRPPVWFVTTGGDTTVMPFPRRALALRQERGFAFTLGVWPRALWMRRGIRAAEKIWTQPIPACLEPLQRIGVPHERIHTAPFRVPLDVEAYNRLTFDEAKRLVPETGALEGSDFILFHPSRMMIRDEPALRETGQWKANDLLLEGFAKFCTEGNAKQPRLVLIDRKAGGDIDLARAIIDRLGISKYVTWMKPIDEDGYTRKQLIAFYSISHAVADDFGIGWFGSIVLEGCAAATPIVTFVDQDFMTRMYPWHPLLVARTPDEICAKLRMLYENPDEAKRVGARSREWVETFHALEAIIAENSQIFRDGMA